MIESIELLLLAIPFLLAVAFVFQTMTETSRKAAWATPATIRPSVAQRSAVASADSNVTDLFPTTTMNTPAIAA